MRTRRYVVSLVAILVLSALGVLGLTVFNARPKLGLDLRGGLSVILAAKTKTTPDVLEQTVQIIRERVNALGTEEPDISRSGNSNIIVQLPGIKDRDRALQVIGQTAQLRFREVLEVAAVQEAKAKGWELTQGDPIEKDVYFPDADKPDRWYHLGPAEVVGDQIQDAYAQFSQNGQWLVQLEFKREGAAKFEQVTRRLAPNRKQLAIVLDRQVRSAPQVNSEITDGRAQIEGTFKEREARDLALVLRTGSLPIELEQQEVRAVSPTLGRASLKAGLLAGLIGLAVVALYMLIFYGPLGLITIFGLGVFTSYVLGLIGFIGRVRGFTLTLAGIAGIIVSVGIAADSYIIYFERIKDEIKEGKSFRSAVDRGFQSAWKTNLSANFVAFMAAIILYLLAVGPVRGFALTLGISSLFDIFLLRYYTHPAVALISRNKRFAGLRAKRVKPA